MNIDKMIDLVEIMTPSPYTERPEGYFTANEFAERTGLTQSTAKERLLALFRAGKIKRVSIKIDRHITFVYGLPDGTDAQ